MVMEALRVAAKESKFMKFVLGGFIFLAVGGLVFTDVRGFFSDGVGRTDVAEVGDQTITLREFDNDLRRALQQTNMTASEAYENGLVVAFLEGQINNLLQLQAAQDLNIYPDNRVVALQMKSMFGNMPRDQIEMVMRAQGLTEQSMASSVRAQIMTRYITAMPLTVANYIPETTKNAEERLASERRSASIYTIPLDKIVEETDISETDIQNYYQNNIGLYTIPESRVFTIGTMTTDMAKKNLSPLTEDDIRLAYDERTSDFQIPETREIAQAMLDNPDDAQEVYEQALNGASLKDALRKVMGNTDDFKAPSSYEREGLLDALSDKAFDVNAKEGDILPPVKTPVGYTVMKLVKITPPSQKPFEEVKASLKEELELTQLYDALYNKMLDTEDMIDSGASFEDVAKRTGLKTMTTDSYKKEEVIAGQKQFSDIVQASPSIVEELYALPEGGVSYPVEIDDETYVVIGIKSVTPQTVKQLEEVRDDIVAAIKREQLEQNAETLLAETINTPETFSIPDGAKKETIRDISRNSDNAYTDIIYSTEIGNYGYQISDGKAIIVKVDNVSFTSSKPEIDEDTIRRQQLVMLDSLLARYYRDKIDVTINEPLLKRTYSATSVQ